MGVGGLVDGDRAVPVVEEVVLVLARVRRQRDAGVVDEDVEAAERAGDRLDRTGAAGPRSATSVTTPIGRVVAVGAADLLDDGIDAVLADVDDGDPGPLVGEQVGGRPAHAARRAGHQGALGRRSIGTVRSAA